MPRDCLRIIESKSKVRNSRNKPVVAKVSSITFTPRISFEVAELKDMVKALLLDKKNQSPAPTPVKAVEESCVTCGGAHSYQTCPATTGNVYRDNIQEYVSQAAAANYNQGNTGYRAPISNQIRPPGFPPAQNNHNVVQPPSYQAPAYQAPAPQIQGVSKEDFQSYVKANDAVMRNMQTQGQNMQNQLTNLTDMLSKFVTSNTASTSGTLPSNTVTNPKEDLKEREPEVTKDTMPPTNNGSTEDIQPPVIPVVHHESISDPVNALVSASKPNQKASIPFPSRRNDERRREKANDQIEKFYEIFRDLSFEISFTDALMLMPKFASTLKTLIRNKEKLSEMARTPLNENCSAVILNKLPKKLGDPGRFLIPCEFSGINTCNALADLGASINLMPYSVWKNLSLPELTPTCMTLELADRSISEPIGIAEDVYVTVGKFQFPADFVVVDFEPDPRVPLILGRSFLKTSRALIDVYEGEITLRVGREAITFNLDQTSRYTANYNHMTANRIDVIDMACEEYSQEVLGFSNVISSGNPTPYYDPIVSTTSPTLTPFGDSDFLLFEEADSFLAIEDDPTSPDDPSPPPPNQGNYFPETRKDLKICEANNENSSVNEPPEVELKDLPPHLEYAFLEGDDKLPVIIAKDLKNEEKAALIEISIDRKDKDKTTFTCHTNNLPYRRSFWLSQCTGRRFKRSIPIWTKYKTVVEDTNLVLNWEKSHFMVKEGIVLGHKISKSGIEVDRAKVDVIAKLPHPTTVKGVKAVPGQRKNKHIPQSLIASKTMTEAQAHYTTTEKELLAVVYAFEKFRSYLVLSKSIVYTDHSAIKYLFAKKDAKPRLMRWILLLQEFDVIIRDKKGAENLAADHLSRLENPIKIKLETRKIRKHFPLETLGAFCSRVEYPMVCRFRKLPCGNCHCQGNVHPNRKKVCAWQRSSDILRSLPQWTHGHHGANLPQKGL
ncbi:reverse transcriptase domain-containing protein [Tanacetum coccineum]|uniref:RNA-directed DNA polymerase n=1 Tax=Tanacetum coccineum TaxID=301880 RepID=A0ABQ5BZG4_9ASTR